MKNLFIFLVLNIFCLISFAYNFSLYCREDPKGNYDAKLKCHLTNKEDRTEAGSIFISYSKQKKVLNIDDLAMEDKFQGRGLSSILLYHGIQYAKDFLKLEGTTLQLLDFSSIRAKTGKPQYVRYGFRQDKDFFFKMNLEEFLNEDKNKERYRKRYEKDTIEGVYNL